MHILLTRPLDDCLEMIVKFKSLGHKVSHLPLLNIEKLQHPEINFDDYLDDLIQKKEDSYDWDGLWDVNVQRAETYWSAEFKIPFSTSNSIKSPF